MKKILSLLFILGMGILALSNSNVEAKGSKGRHRHHVSSHSRRITTTKNGVTRTRTIHVKGYRSK